MLTEDRRQEILNIIRQNKSVTIASLVSLFNISESTARRDLLWLQQKGGVNRVHGGAILEGEDPYDADLEDLQRKYSFHIEAKQKIAQKAAQLIEDGDFIYLDSGSTVEQISSFLSSKKATFVTNSVVLAQRLAREHIKVYILPGHVKYETAAIIGIEMREMLKKYHFDKGFFGTNGIDMTLGCTTPDIEEAAGKAAAIAQCKEAYVLTDGSKFNKASHVTFSALSDIKIITTKDTLTVKIKDYQKETEVHLI